MSILLFAFAMCRASQTHTLPTCYPTMSLVEQVRIYQGKRFRKDFNYWTAYISNKAKQVQIDRELMINPNQVGLKFAGMSEREVTEIITAAKNSKR